MTDSVSISLDEVEIPQLDEHPVTSSVKLHGPPGTGKTTKCAARVAMLLKDHGYALSDVAWCTYRTSLAADTLSRLHEWGLVSDVQMQNPSKGPTSMFGTAHALGYRLCNGLGDPVEEGHKRHFCSIHDIPFANNKVWKKTRGQLLFETFYWLKKNLYDPSDQADVYEAPMFSSLQNQWQGVDVPQLWAQWCEYKRGKNIIDFHEMLEEPLKREKAPRRSILVVDEYHDAYPLLAKTAQMWMKYADIIIVAGDPNQVVNSFDGASPRFFQDLDLPTVLLDQSYRVPSGQMRMSELVLSEAHQPPAVEPREETGEVEEYLSPKFEYTDGVGWDVPSRDEEGSPGWLIDEYGEETMFLARTKQQVEGIARSLDEIGVMYKTQDKLGGWNTDNARTRFAVFNALQKIRGLGPGDFGGGSHGLNAYHSNGARVVSKNDSLEASEANELLGVVAAEYLDGTRDEVEDRVKALIDADELLSLTDLDEVVEPEFWNIYTQGAESVSNLNKTGGEVDLTEDDRYALISALQRYDVPVAAEDITAQVLTAHASKGQQAPHVVVYDGVTRTISDEVSKNRAAEQNEWRTWYVALTRASEHVHIMRDAFDWTSSFLPDKLVDRTRQALSA